MPCVRNLSVQHALEYFKDDIQKKEAKGFDYYSQEDSGVWFGKTAEKLGFIDKKFSEKDYKDVIEGKFSYFDTNTGKTVNVDLTKNSKNKEHHAGIEITLSAPKSVSIIAEVFKDNRVRDAHTMALNNVMEYIQNNLVYTRSSKDGKMQLEKVDNLLAIKFTHHTNRNHDPQLHTHILVANIIIDKHGKVKTAEHTSIFECERFIRELYYNELANNLIQLGYEVEWQKKVTQMAPEIKIVPHEFNELFSTRRKQIEEFARQHNISLEDAEGLGFGCLATRKAKDNSIGVDELLPVWLEKVNSLGINIGEFKARIYQKNLDNLSNLKTLEGQFNKTYQSYLKNSSLSKVDNVYIDNLNKNLEKLSSMNSVKDLNGNEFPNNGENLIERVSKFYESIGGKVERDDIDGYIKINRRGIKDSCRHGLCNNKAIAFMAVPDIIKNGIIISKQNNWKDRGYNTYLISAPITINKTKYMAEGIVMESNDGSKRFYLHEVEEFGKFQDYLKQGLMSTETSSKLNLAKFIKEVKDIQTNIDKNTLNINNIVNNAIQHLTERQSTFTREQLISSIMDRSNGRYSINQIQMAIDYNKELINNNLELEKYSKHLRTFSEREKIIFTTKTQIEMEDKILNFIESGKNKFKSVIEISGIAKNNDMVNMDSNLLFGDKDTTANNNVKNNKTYFTLNDNQKMTVDFILNNKDQFLAIQGYAGVGKTYTIKALNEILKENNIELIGLAPTHSASNTLKNEADIRTETLQNFLAKYNGYANDRELNKNSLKDFKKIFSNKIILVDESSLISNKQMKELVTIANKFNVRVILQGDQKQLDSVESGTPFHRLIDGKYIQYSELNNILRQKDETIKQAVYDIIKKDIRNSFQKLKNSKHIIELRTNEQLNSKGLKENLYKFNEKTGKNELNQEVYNKYLTFLENSNIDKIKTDLIHSTVKTYNNLAKEEKDNTIIITSSNEIRKEINKEIRKNIKLDNEKSRINNELKSIIIKTLELKSLTSQEKKEIENYNINDSITFLKNNNKLNIKKDIEYNIADINKDTNEIILKLKNDNKQQIVVNIQKQSNNLNLYSKESKELIINDKIRFTTAHKEIGIYKNSNFVVKDINKTENIITLIDNDKQKQELKLDLNKNTEKELIKHVDYDYTTTTYSSQGKTSHNVIYTLESYRPILTTQKDFYVGLSRAKDNITIITDNIDKSISALIANTGERLGAKEVEIENTNSKTNKTLNNDLTLNNVNNEINLNNGNINKVDSMENYAINERNKDNIDMDL